MPAFDLAAAARQEMLDEGFEPDIPSAAQAQAAAIAQPAAMPGARDLRSLQWSSIDNDSSRDLDQIEVADRTSDGIRVRIGIADVDGTVGAGCPIDDYARSESTTVYTGVRTFPMLPERLSTDLTSLAENEDRLAMVIEFVVAAGGSIVSSQVYRALVRNRAQLTYNAVGPWLEGPAPAPAKVAAMPDLGPQLRLQDEASRALHEARHRMGALEFDRVESEAVIKDGEVRDVAIHRRNRASELIENFMVAANQVMAKTLVDAGVSSIRRVVRSPKRWPRIVELAAGLGETLPAEPDAPALSAFLARRRAADGAHYSDLSLAVMKLMGPGEYMLSKPGEPAEGHFALAAHDYTHSTAPNRRFADVVTQRLIKAVLGRGPAPYADDALDAIARNCTLKEDAARKVERAMNKRVAAVALQNRIGQSFAAVVTGVAPKGTFVRILDPPVEGRLVHGFEGADVGDRLRVRLTGADPRRGFIDFTRE